jgi:hypothetical protein
MATHLVIGDPHCTPKANNDRFLWAGRLAADFKVTHVICMGDFCSMDSLSTYDRGKKSFEGRRYQKDMDHSHEALSLFNKGLGKHKAKKIMLHAHHFPSGIMGSAISGENIGRTLLTKHKVSATVGHSHLLDYAVSTLPNGKKLHGLSAGCYLNHDEHFARDTQHMWWSGLIVKREVKDGNYNIETIDIKTIRREYGKK